MTSMCWTHDCLRSESGGHEHPHLDGTPDRRTHDGSSYRVRAVVWGTTYVVTTLFLPDGHALWSGVLRALPAGLLLVAIGRTLPSGDWWWKALVLGTLNIGAFFPLLFVAAHLLPGGIAAVFGAVSPLVIAALALPMLAERPTRWRLFWGVLAVVGVAMMVLAPGVELSLLGVLAGCAAPLSMAVGTVLSKRWGRPVGPVAYAGWQLTAGGLVIVPGAIMIEGDPPVLDGAAMAGYAWLGLIGAALAYILWFRGVGSMPAGAVAFLPSSPRWSPPFWDGCSSARPSRRSRAPDSLWPCSRCPAPRERHHGAAPLRTCRRPLMSWPSIPSRPSSPPGSTPHEDPSLRSHRSRRVAHRCRGSSTWAPRHGSLPRSPQHQRHHRRARAGDRAHPGRLRAGSGRRGRTGARCRRGRHATRPRPGARCRGPHHRCGRRGAEGRSAADRRRRRRPLQVPGTPQIALDDPQRIPTAIRPIAAASVRQLEILRSASGLDWTYLAPAADFGPGPRTGDYRTAAAALVIDEHGRSSISMEDFAIALMDEIEFPTTRRGILSTGY